MTSILSCFTITEVSLCLYNTAKDSSALCCKLKVKFPAVIYQLGSVLMLSVQLSTNVLAFRIMGTQLKRYHGSCLKMAECSSMPLSSSEQVHCAGVFLYVFNVKLIALYVIQYFCGCTLFIFQLTKKNLCPLCHSAEQGMYMKGLCVKCKIYNFLIYLSALLKTSFISATIAMNKSSTCVAIKLVFLIKVAL